ncbi:MAG TPA: hypothetical protein PKD61_19415 [Polyangiaceae bacterium]|nr:hypothetical protein [Polyangiaceae bacterium]
MKVQLLVALPRALAWALLCCGCGNSAELCGEQLAAHELRVFSGSILEGEALSPGKNTGCKEATARQTIDALSRALDKLPTSARVPLDVHVDVSVDLQAALPVRTVEAHASGALLVGKAPTDETIWLHEIFHTQAGHPTSSAPLVARTLRALEEGSADYFAATFAGTAQVGGRDGREVRNLMGPERADELLWLRFAQGKADSHLLGSMFARELWSERPSSPGVAQALVGCLRNATQAQLKDVSELSASCPKSSRPVVERAVARWTLRSPQTPTNPPRPEEL